MKWENGGGGGILRGWVPKWTRRSGPHGASAGGGDDGSLTVSMELEVALVAL